jgi:recombinational DNA repair protein (RecF pathway)
MYRCVICRFETELDDVIAPTASGRCVCLRCFARETDTLRPMPRALQRALSALLASQVG